jgi:hypothetical protein
MVTGKLALVVPSRAIKRLVYIAEDLFVEEGTQDLSSFSWILG